MSFKRAHIALIVLSIFYTVGIAGMLLPEYQQDFLALTPLNLLLTLGILIWANRDFSLPFWVTFAIVFCIGFGAEVAGVHTGLLFGNYGYGAPLGPQVFAVPLTIGVNWFILSYASRGISNQLIPNKIAQAAVAALLMTLLDFLIEPVAIYLDFWHWENNVVPIQNYIAWFTIAFAIQLLIGRMKIEINKQVAIIVFAVQLVFFVALNLSF